MGDRSETPTYPGVLGTRGIWSRRMAKGARDGRTPNLRAVAAPHPHPRPVFPGKLRVPPVDQSTVDRPRLTEVIDTALERGHLIVSTPAGSGKTNLLAAWAGREKQGREVAWLTVGEGEGDPERFLDHLGAALSSTVVGTRAAMALTGTPGSGDEAHLAVLAEAGSDLGLEVVVVLDDFHLLVGSDTEGLLRRVLRYPPGPLHFVVLSREEPALAQTALRLQGRLREFGPTDLAFTLEETAEFFQLRGLKLAADEVEQLHGESVGWVAAIRAASEGLAGATAGRDVAAAVKSARRFAWEYFAAEVIGRQAPEIQEFLRRATTVDPVCGLVADALTGREGGARTLADLYRSRLFLEPDGAMTDERCTWYRWHPMFAGVLRGQLRDAEPGLESELHRTAADWMSHHGMAAEAVEHALAGGAVDTAARVLEDNWVELVLAGQGADVGLLLSLFDPDRVYSDPEFALIAAFMSAQEKDLSRGCLLAQEAVEHHGGLSPDRQLTVELTAVNVRLCVAGLNGCTDSENLYPSGLSMLEQVAGGHRSLTVAQRRLRTALLYHLGTFELSQWRYDDAVGHLGEALAESAILGMASFVLDTRAQLAVLDLLAGRLGMALSVARDVIDTPQNRSVHFDQRLAVALMVMATVHEYHGEREEALEWLRQARDTVRPSDRVNRLRIAFLTHRVLLEQGQLAPAEQALDDLRTLAGRMQSPTWTQLTVAVAEASGLLASREVEAALKRLESVASAASGPPENLFWRRHYAELLLHVGRAEEARELLKPVIAPGGSRLLQVQALLVDCLAAEALGSNDDSAGSLTSAVRLAAPEAIAQPFLSNAAGLRAPLERLLHQGTAYDKFLAELLARMREEAPVDTALPAHVEQLSARELEVLHVLRDGADNDAIAAELFISPNTLRSHIKKINRKLGTTNRREAVNRARRMRLL
jgi:LuxR family transcriptional regulator, maltose regulon positive regulatory protein